MKRICKTCTWWCGEESEQSAFCDEKEIFTSAECYCPKWTEKAVVCCEHADTYPNVPPCPSCGAEPLTDGEQRIFLAAMDREKAICKEVDAHCPAVYKSNQDSLVRTCNEIERKVKNTLWPNSGSAGKRDIIREYHDYLVDRLLSHCDIEPGPETETLIVQFLNDAVNRYITEET